MILASLFLVLASLGLLVIGVVQSSLALVWAALAASLLAAAALTAAVLSRRRTAAAAVPVQTGPPPAPPLTASPMAAPPPASPTPAPPPQAVQPRSTEPPVEQPSGGAADAGAALAADPRPVLVVDGHPRYHLAGCPALDGAETDALPVGEARADGFTPCGWCRPDARLLSTRQSGRDSVP